MEKLKLTLNIRGLSGEFKLFVFGLSPVCSPVHRCYLPTFLVSCLVLALFFYVVRSVSHHANQTSFAHISKADMFCENDIYCP